jgi:hypothetical protein
VNTEIKFDIDTTDANAALGVEVWLNDQKLLDCDHVTQAIPVAVPVDDDVEVDNQLKIVLKNKTSEHTAVDEQGNIIKDSCLMVQNFKLDDVDIDQLISEKAVYCHNFNGNADYIDDEFYWVMGCNGTVTLNFFTPTYIWLLENM